MFISTNAQKILKVLHLLAVSYWIGGNFSTVILCYLSMHAESDIAMYGLLRSSNLISIVAIAYVGAFGSFFTGVAYSLCTHRGFFRHKWIIIKWFITAGIILLGFLFFAPANTTLLETVLSLGAASVQDREIELLQFKSFCLKLVSMSLFVVAIVLSVYKPWEEKELAAMRKRARRLSMSAKR